MINTMKAIVSQHGGNMVDNRDSSFKAEFPDSYSARSFYYSMLPFNNVIEMTFPTPDRVQVFFPANFTRKTPSQLEGLESIAATL